MFVISCAPDQIYFSPKSTTYCWKMPLLVTCSRRIRADDLFSEAPWLFLSVTSTTNNIHVSEQNSDWAALVSFSTFREIAWICQDSSQIFRLQDWRGASFESCAGNKLVYSCAQACKQLAMEFFFFGKCKMSESWKVCLTTSFFWTQATGILWKSLEHRKVFLSDYPAAWHTFVWDFSWMNGKLAKNLIFDCALSKSIRTARYASWPVFSVIDSWTWNWNKLGQGISLHSSLTFLFFVCASCHAEVWKGNHKGYALGSSTSDAHLIVAKDNRTMQEHIPNPVCCKIVLVSWDSFLVFLQFFSCGFILPPRTNNVSYSATRTFSSVSELHVQKLYAFPDVLEVATHMTGAAVAQFSWMIQTVKKFIWFLEIGGLFLLPHA